METETKQIRIQIEANGLHYEASGTAEEIVPQILQFLSQTVPTYDIAKKLLYVTDLAGLSDTIAEYAKITNTGQLLLTRSDLSAEKAISIVLLQDSEARLRFTKHRGDCEWCRQSVEDNQKHSGGTAKVRLH
jgi:hypothetical protein